MCGIAGLWSPRLTPPERHRLVQAMLEHLRHRGPSGNAIWDGTEITLGLARLAIVAPHQPAAVLHNESGTVHAVVNGEIYNHDDLRRDLQVCRHVVPSGPDTAVIPHLYEEHAAEFPLRLDGMFAIALWDAPRHRLVLARDRAGEKPLFLSDGPEGFAFASEPGALTLLPWVSRDPSPEALARYLVHGCFAGRDCAFASLSQLPPAHVHVREDARERRFRYWRPWDRLGDLAGRLTDAQAPEATRAALHRAVASRVPGDVPFGVFLSGGVDSGLVATLAARILSRRFPTFSLRMAHRGYDEADRAREVAASIETEHHELVMDAAAGAEALESFASDMDQPLGDPSVLPTWALARLAARYVPVVLTGEGGDELFAGYPTYLGHTHAALADSLPDWASDSLRFLSRRFRPRHHHVTLAHLLEGFLGTRGMSPFDRHLAWFGTARSEEALALLSSEVRSKVAPEAPLGHARALAEQLVSAGVVTADDLRAAASGPGRRSTLGITPYQILDFEVYLSGDLLTKVDRCTMAHGLESRAPFLRHALIEFALNLPERARLRGTTTKWALKRAARGLLPDEVLERRKQGFSPPFAAWVRGPLRAKVQEILAPERIKSAGILDPVAVTRLLRAHLDHRIDRGRTLWALLSLQMWAERWVMGAGATVLPVADAALDSSEEVAARAAFVPATVNAP